MSIFKILNIIIYHIHSSISFYKVNNLYIIINFIFFDLINFYLNYFKKFSFTYKIMLDCYYKKYIFLLF